ncbi:MAG: hypothetical protein NC489_44725, partial [Ruminococcus flavefaciens]|nr:hypothetical protein [Ruminococcus flavefaciens]
GTEKGAIDAITAAINGQTKALDSLTEKEWQETVNEFNKDPDRKWTEKIGDGWANFWSGSKNNYDRMIKEMEDTEVTFSFSTLGNKNYKDFKKKIEDLFNASYIYDDSANFDTFKLTGNLDDIYAKLLDIHNLADEMNVDSYMLNGLDNAVAESKSKLEDYEEFYKQSILQDKIFKDDSYTEIFNTINEEYKKYQEAFTSGDEDVIEEAKQNFAKIVQSSTEGINDKSVVDYFNSMYPDLQEVVGGWQFEVKFKAAIDDKNDGFENDIQEYLSQFDKSEDIINFNSKNATDEQKDAYIQLKQVAHDYSLSLDQLIDRLVRMGLIFSQAKDDLLDKLIPSRSSLTAGIQSELDDVASQVDSDAATEWVQSLTEEEAVFANSDAFTNALEEQKEQLNGAALSAENYDAALESVKNSQSEITDTIPSDIQSAWDSLSSTESDSLKSLKEDLISLAEAGQLTEETFHETDGADIFLEGISESASEAVQWINRLVSSSDQLSSMGKEISGMSDALATKKNDKFVDTDTLGGFSAGVKGLDSWEKFEKLLGDSTSSMEDCQKAADALATEFVNSNNFLAQLDETNRDYYTTQLKNMGVSNAQEVVTDALARKKKEEALATEYLSLAISHNSEEKNKNSQITTELTKATTEEIIQLISEGTVSDETAESLADYALEKYNASKLTIMTSADCSNLYSLVSALGVAGSALKTYAYLKSVIESASTWSDKELADATVKNAEQALKNIEEKAQKEVKDAQNLDAGVSPSVNPSGSGSSKSSSSGGSGSSSAANQSVTTIDWIGKKLDSLQKKIDATKAKFENLFTVKDKHDNISKQITQMKSLLNATEKAAKKYKKYADRVDISDALKKKVQSGDYSIKDYDSDTADKISRYEEYYNKYIDLKKQADELETEIRNAREERLQLYVDDAEAKLARSEAHAALDEGNYEEQNRHIENQKKYLKQSYDYQIKIAKLNGDSIKADQLKAEYQKEIRDLTKEEFDNIANQYGNSLGYIKSQMDIIDSQMAQLGAKGYVASKSYYSRLLEQESRNLEQLREEREALQEQLNKGLEDGSVTEYSDTWYDMVEAINEADNAIVQAATSLIEYGN